MIYRVRVSVGLAFFLLWALPSLRAAQNIRVATYNVENYLSEASGTRPAKTPAAKAKVCEGILALKPDVLALQEMGDTNILLELQNSLKTNGLDLPFWEHITGYDTNIHVAILSRFPIVSRHPHTNDPFLINGHRFISSRGFAEVEIQVSPLYSFTLIDVHLKSKRPIAITDEADLRLEEAKVLRQKVDDWMLANPQGNLVVLGDLNDSHDSAPIKTILGKGKKSLIDVRPAERNGDAEPHSDRRLSPRTVTWTHFYAKEDTYGRIDYILLNHKLASALNPQETYVLALPNWGLASDHRPLVVTFRTD